MARLTNKELKERFLKSGGAEPVEKNPNSKNKAVGNDNGGDENIGAIHVSDPLLNSPVIEKEEAKLKTEIIGDIPDEIEEPVIRPTPINFNENGEGDAGGDDKKIGAGQESGKTSYNGEGEGHNYKREFDPGPVQNKSLEDLSPSMKKKAAELLADTCLKGYQNLNDLGKSFIKFDENKQQKEILKGKFDPSTLSVRLPVGISVAEFLDFVNENADEIMRVKQEFIDEAKPLLVEILKRRGAGFTPEQRLLALVVEDSLPKIFAIIELKSLTTQILRKVEQDRRRRNERQQPPPPPPPPPPTNPGGADKDSGETGDKSHKAEIIDDGGASNNKKKDYKSKAWESIKDIIAEEEHKEPEEKE